MSTEFSDAALQRIMDVAKLANGAKDRVLVTEIDGGTKLLISDSYQGTKDIIPKTPGPFHRSLYDLDSISRFVRDHATGDVPCSVWIGKEVYVIRHEQVSLARGDSYIYSLSYTPEFQMLVDMEQDEGQSFSQSELIDLIRVKLWYLFKSDKVRDTLLNQLRKIVAQQTSAIQSGRGTYEAGLQTQSGETIEWVDRFVLQVKCFDDAQIPEASQDVEVVFTVDPHSKTFTLLPTLRSLRAAQQLEFEKISEILEESIIGHACDGYVSFYKGCPYRV